MNLDPNSPAFPQIETAEFCSVGGLTIRAHFASLAMQNMSSHRVINRAAEYRGMTPPPDEVIIAYLAVNFRPSKHWRALEEDGMIQGVEYKIGPVTCQGWELTQRGHITYCESFK